MNDFHPLISFLDFVELPKTGGQSHFFLNKAQPNDEMHKTKSIIHTDFETFFIRAVKDMWYSCENQLLRFRNSDCKKISTLVDKIITLKAEGKDTLTLEQEIDRLVYELYEITLEEQQLIESK